MALSIIGRNVGWLLAGKGFGALLSIVYLGLATRTLGTSGFGQFAIILGLAQTIAGTVTFQTWRLIILYGHTNRHAAEEKPTSVNDIVGFGLKLDCLAAGVGCLLAIVSVPLLAGPMGWSHSITHISLAFAIVMLLSIRSTAVGTLRLYDKFRHGATADAIMPLTRMMGAAAAAIWFPTVLGFLAAWALSEITTAIAYWIAVRRHTPVRVTFRTEKTMRAVMAAHPGIIRFALITNAGSTLSSLIQNLPLLAIGFYAGSALSGLYRLANQLAQAMMRIADMLNRSVYPELAKTFAHSGHDAARDLVRKTTIVALGGSAIIMTLTVTIGRYAIELIAGPAFLPAYPLLVILGIASSLELAGVAFEPMLTASGRAMTTLVIRLAATLILAVSLAILLPAFGTAGAAVATLITTLFALSVSAHLVRKMRAPPETEISGPDSSPPAR